MTMLGWSSASCRPSESMVSASETHDLGTHGPIDDLGDLPEDLLGVLSPGGLGQEGSGWW